MIKQIRGRKYDTERATVVGTVRTMASNMREVQHIEKTLYRKRTGEYFLYSVRVDAGTDASSPTWDIEPMTPLEAERWAKKNFKKEDFIVAFPPEGESSGARVTTSISLKRENYEKIKELAMRSNMPLRKFLDRVIQNLEGTF